MPFEREDSVRKLSLGQESVQGVLTPHFKPTGGHQRLPEHEARQRSAPRQSLPAAPLSPLLTLRGQEPTPHIKLERDGDAVEEADPARSPA